MKYNLVTKKNIAIAVFIILVIIATVCFDYFRTLNANNQQLTKMLQAVEQNPVSSEIKDKDGNNITEDFLKRYKEDFKKRRLQQGHQRNPRETLFCCCQL